MQAIKKGAALEVGGKQLRDGPWVPAHNPHEAAFVERSLPLFITRFKTPYRLYFLARQLPTGDVVPEML